MTFSVDSNGVPTKTPRFEVAIRSHLSHDGHGDLVTSAGILDNETGLFAGFTEDPSIVAVLDLADFAIKLNADPFNPFTWVEPVE
jgi:hypothetical protein